MACLLAITTSRAEAAANVTDFDFKFQESTAI
jgi:hypothetical protein